jgi:signal transduction histidine kinase
VAREAIEPRQIAILRDISQGWGAATTLEETMASIVHSTHAALDSPGTSVRLLLPSASNRLRVRMSVPHKLEGSQWRGRRTAYVTRRPVQRRPRSGRSLVLALPLLCREVSVGVLEIQAAIDAIEDRRSLLNDVASQAARALRAAQERGSAGGDYSVTERLGLGVALTAHELRGPLAGVSAAIEAVAATATLDEEQRCRLLACRHELQYLYELAEGALRWFLGAAEPARCPIDLVQLVRDAAASCALEAGDTRTVVVPQSGVVVLGDHNLLRAAISNVIRNALAYSPPRTPVHIAVHSEGPTATVEVSDFGPGVSADELETIFEPFARGSAGRIDRSGRGLGLFIARRAIEASNGAIHARSEGSGAAFCISLPTIHAGQQG